MSPCVTALGLHLVQAQVGPVQCCQSLWIQMCISPEAFRRSCFLSVLRCFWLLHFLCHCFCKVPSPEGKMSDGHIPFRAACSKVPHSGNIVWLWVLVFVPIYCRSNLLWQYWAWHWLTNPCLPNHWQNDSTFKYTAKKVHPSCLVLFTLFSEVQHCWRA